jgi:hypothetical protein
MDRIKQTKDLLENNRAFLIAEKEEIIKRLKDPRITAWSKVKFAPLANMLKVLGISGADLQNSLKNYSSQGKEISKQIKLCNTEISNQLADLIGCKSPDKAVLAAQKVKLSLQQLAELKAAIYSEIEIFIAADKTLRQSLNIDALTPLALRLAQKQKHLFNEGLEIYRIITEQSSPDQATLSMDETSQEVVKLESRFKNIEILGLPRLAEEIVYHYVKIGNDTLQQVATFTKTTTGLLTADLGAIHNLKVCLAELNKSDTITILTDISKHALTVSKIISGLYHKKELKNTIVKIAETLELLNIYHLAIKNKIIPKIKEDIEDPQSEINPIVIAAKMTRSFFTGTKGIILSMKLMVKSLAGHEAINQVELQLILEKAITNCKIFYGKSAKDIKELRIFIDDLINQFSRPFPYDNILVLVKQTIAVYGNNVEKIFKQYETKKNFQTIAKTKIPATFGKLAVTVVNKRDAFKKANK